MSHSFEKLYAGPLLDISKAEQIQLMLKYRALDKNDIANLVLSDFGFRMFSQHDEDGILLFIFSRIGVLHKTFVEIGCGNGIENNTANLTLNHAWHGLLIDGNEDNIACANHFYSSCLDSLCHSPKILNTMVNPDNVNKLLKTEGFTEEIDLLSLDIDGFDWWVWKALKVINPRVVIVETPTVWGPEDSFTIPYDKNFVFDDPDYYGASVLAYTKLAEQKGYRLIGCNRYGTNCFFLRNDLGQDQIDAVPVKGCYVSHRAQHGVNTRRPNVLKKKWIKV